MKNHQLIDINGLGPAKVERLKAHGIENPTDLVETSFDDLVAIPGFSNALVRRIRQAARRLVKADERNQDVGPVFTDASSLTDTPQPEPDPEPVPAAMATKPLAEMASLPLGPDASGLTEDPKQDQPENQDTKDKKKKKNKNKKRDTSSKKKDKANQKNKRKDKKKDKQKTKKNKKKKNKKK